MASRIQHQISTYQCHLSAPRNDHAHVSFVGYDHQNDRHCQTFLAAHLAVCQPVRHTAQWYYTLFYSATHMQCTDTRPTVCESVTSVLLDKIFY